MVISLFYLLSNQVVERLHSTSMHLNFLGLNHVHQHRIASENRLRALQEPIGITL